MEDRKSQILQEIMQIVRKSWYCQKARACSIRALHMGAPSNTHPSLQGPKVPSLLRQHRFPGDTPACLTNRTSWATCGLLGSHLGSKTSSAATCPLCGNNQGTAPVQGLAVQMEVAQEGETALVPPSATLSPQPPKVTHALRPRRGVLSPAEQEPSFRGPQTCL